MNSWKNKADLDDDIADLKVSVAAINLCAQLTVTQSTVRNAGFER